MTPDARGDGPGPRPASPFALLLLGLATTAVGAEWLRFQSSVIVAAPVAAVGLAATLGAVARAYRARRRWRRARSAEAPGAGAEAVAHGAAPRAATHGATPGGTAPRPRVAARVATHVAPAPAPLGTPSAPAFERTGGAHAHGAASDGPRARPASPPVTDDGVAPTAALGIGARTEARTGSAPLRAGGSERGITSPQARPDGRAKEAS